MKKSWLALLAVAVAACGGDKTPKSPDDTAVTAESDDDDDAPAASDGNDGAAKKAAEPKVVGGIPTECAAHDGDVCLPDKKWVRKFCSGDYATVAMSMFQSGTPWTRGYITQKTKAVNASGGGSTGEMMYPEEEVIVLHKFAGQSPGGIQVSGADGGYDAMRWDGQCVTLDVVELRFDPPRGDPGNAKITWTNIDYDVRDELKKIDVIRKGYIARKKACRGVTVGAVSKACEKLDKELSVTIARWVRANDSFPTPKKVPE